jgi:hypothetical protein
LYYRDVDVSKFEWARNPSAPNNVSGLTTCEQEQLTDISRDGSFKDTFHADKLPQFWLLVINDHRSLSDKAMNVLLPFVTIYLWKLDLLLLLCHEKYIDRD